MISSKTWFWDVLGWISVESSVSSTDVYHTSNWAHVCPCKAASSCGVSLCRNKRPPAGCPVGPA